MKTVNGEGFIESAEYKGGGLCCCGAAYSLLMVRIGRSRASDSPSVVYLCQDCRQDLIHHLSQRG